MPTTEMLATLSAHVYGNVLAPTLPPGVVQVRTFGNPDTGFKGAAYLELATNTVILAFAGTDRGDAGDLLNDKAIAMGLMPPQRYDAWAAFEAAGASVPPGGSLAVTGHSLGGALAQAVVNQAVNSGLPVAGVTFASPGMAEIVAKYGDRISTGIADHLTNYVTPSDPISNFGGHIGGKVVLPGLPSQLVPFSFQHPGGALGWLLRQHSIRIYLEHFRRLFKAASPVIVDLDGDGVETRAVQSGVFFDHDDDGFAQQTGWVGADDAFLARDLNGNGRIDSGRELFGSHTLLPSGLEASDGFQALAAVDGNGDGRLDGADDVWSQLRLWRDGNSDGVAGAGELLTLESAGLASVATTGTPSAFVDDNGNAHALVGGVIREDGATGSAADVWFQQDLVESVATESVSVPADVGALPDVHAYGTVRDLHQAIVRDATGQLRASLEAFVAATSPAQRKAVLEELLFRWTGAQGIAPGSRGPLVDARQLHVLEQFMGEAYVGVTGPNPHHISAPVLVRGYERVFEMVYASLVAQTELAGLYELLSYEWDESIGEVRSDFAAVEADLVARIEADPAGGNASLGEFARSLHGLGLEGGRAFWRFRQEMGELGAEYATTIDSWLRAVITGTAAGETVNGTAGDDLIDGGAGDDVLAGGGGADTYVLRRGMGQETIFDLSPSDNRIVASDVSPADVQLRRDGQHLVLTIAGTSDQVTISHWFGAEVYVNGGWQWAQYQIEEVGFAADGTAWDVAALKQKAIEGTAGDDGLTGYDESGDTIVGLAGNDQLAGGAGDDVLDGGPGADGLSGEAGADTLLGGADGDVLIGAAGNDTLDGGAGNDSLDGQADDDTYRFGRGAGQDTAWDLAAAGSGGADRVVVAADVAPSELTVQRSGTNLVLGIAGTADQLVIRGWFGESFYAGGWYVNQYQVERVEFLADGTAWDVAALLHRSLLGQGTSGPDTLTGTAGADELRGLGGDDVLRGGDGDDLLDGGPGADAMWGDAGHDTYVVDDAGDVVTEAGGQGTDTVQSAISYTLPANVESLTLTGAAAINGTGNGLGNRLTGNSAINALAGGPGDDVYVVDNAGDVVTEGSSQGTDTVESTVSYTLPSNVEILTLTGAAAISATGNGLGNVLNGNAAANTLDGRGGADAMAGGPGDDWYVVDHAGDVIVEQAGEGTDSVQSSVTYTLPASVENLTLIGNSPASAAGNGSDNVLTGNGKPNTLTGGAGNDTYVVQDTNDVVVESAGAGLDTVRSSVSYTLPSHVENLTLTGSSGINGAGNGLDNVLTGNSGANTLTGGAGNDTYGVHNAHDVVVESAGAGTDTIQSAVAYTLPANVENLTLTGAASISGTGNSLANVLAGNGAANVLTGGAGSDTYLFDPGSGQDVVVDTDATAGNSDVARFGATIDPLDLVIRRIGNDLVLSVHGTADTVSVRDWYLGADHQVETIQAGDASRLQSVQVQLLIQDMAAYSTSTGLTWDQAIDQRPDEVQVILAGRWQQP